MLNIRTRVFATCLCFVALAPVPAQPEVSFPGFMQQLRDRPPESRATSGSVGADSKSLSVDGNQVRYSSDSSAIVHFLFDSDGYRNTYVLDCEKRQFRWVENVRLATGKVTDNSAGAEWKPLNPSSTISNAVFDVACPDVSAGVGAKKLSPAWLGTWRSANGKETLTISPKRIDVVAVLNSPEEDDAIAQYDHRWSDGVGADSDTPYTFGFRPTPLSKSQLVTRLEEALSQSDDVFKVPMPESTRALLYSVKAGAHDTLWVYAEGDFDTSYILDGDRLLNIDDTIYSFSISEYFRVAPGTPGADGYTVPKIGRITLAAEQLVLAPLETAKDIDRNSGGLAEYVLVPGERRGAFSFSNNGELWLGDKMLDRVNSRSEETGLLVSPVSPAGLRYIALWDGQDGGSSSAFIVNETTEEIIVADIVKPMKRVGSTISWSPDGSYAVIPDFGEVHESVVMVDVRQGTTESVNIGRLERDDCDSQRISFEGSEWSPDGRFYFTVRLEPNPWGERGCPSCPPCPSPDEREQVNFEVTANLAERTLETPPPQADTIATMTQDIGSYAEGKDKLEGTVIEAVHPRTEGVVRVRSNRVSVKDGSVLAGAITGGEVAFKSSFGKINVELGDVVEFSAGKLRLADGTVLAGEFVEGEVEVTTGVGKVEVAATEIVEIRREDSSNPTAHSTSEEPTAVAGQVSKQALVDALIRDGHVSAECVREASSKDDLIVLRVETGSDGETEYVATGQEGCTCGAQYCFEWVYGYDGRTLRLKEAYQMMDR